MADPTDPTDPPTGRHNPDPGAHRPPTTPPPPQGWPPPDPGAWQAGRPEAWRSPPASDPWPGTGARRPDEPPAPGPWPPEQPSARPPRTPLPTPAAAPHVLRWELALVLLLAFAPGILGLLILALGAGNGNQVDTQLVPAIVGAVFQMFLSWSPVLVIAYLLVRSGEGWTGIGLTRFRSVDAGHGVALWLASFVLVLILARVFSQFGQREVDFLPPALPLWFRLIQAVLIATTAGATEEIVVRGYAQTRLEQLRAPTAVIVLLPTALWGVLHVYQGVGAALTIFCLGLMYAVYFHRTRRLWPLILAHALFDGTQLVFILAGS